MCVLPAITRTHKKSKQKQQKHKQINLLHRAPKRHAPRRVARPGALEPDERAVVGKLDDRPAQQVAEAEDIAEELEQRGQRGDDVAALVRRQVLLFF